MFNPMNYKQKSFNGKFISLSSGLFSNLDQVKCKIFKFPSGEFHIKILDDAPVYRYTIATRFESNSSIVDALITADALRRFSPKAEINLFLPYLPYSRQDRKMVDGEPFSLKVISRLLQTGDFTNIFTVDAHSDVSTAIIDNLVDLSPADYIKQIPNVLDYTWVSPDAGAAKRIYKIAEKIGYKGDIIVANKVRNLSTGEIIRTSIDGDVKGKKLLCIDDICSYGGTFRNLSKILMDYGAEDFKLYVSHYEGVADINMMKNSGISHIYTTNSIYYSDNDDIIKFDLSVT